MGSGKTFPDIKGNEHASHPFSVVLPSDVVMMSGAAVAVLGSQSHRGAKVNALEIIRQTFRKPIQHLPPLDFCYVRKINTSLFKSLRVGFFCTCSQTQS